MTQQGMLSRLKRLVPGIFGDPRNAGESARGGVRATRTIEQVMDDLGGHPDPAAARAAAANPAEEAYYDQTDRFAEKWHHYLTVYDRHLARFRGTPVRLLEIGVHQGGSLQVWRRYLGPDAVIHGLDIDPRCAGIDDPDLTVHIGSQDDAALLARIVEAMGGLDVVIEDGSHIWSHQVATFEALYPKLSERGIYLCEDTHTSYWPAFGAGRPEAESFVSYAKRLVDRLHAPYRLNDAARADAFARGTASVSFYDSLVVIEKRPSPLPFRSPVGRRTLP